MLIDSLVLKNFRSFFIFWVTLCIFSASARATLAKFANLEFLDFPVPFCDGVLGFDATSQFVEIENKLPGVDAYNDLVRKYHQKKYSELVEGFLNFRKLFESSPLIEAVDFLELQSDLEQLNFSDAESVKNLEARFRNLIVLYPKSSLAPVLHASLSSFYLKSGAFPKALGISQAAKEDYPFHETSCAHLQNASEANYHLGNFEDAASGFQLMAQKCQNVKQAMNAKVRLIDISRQTNENLREVENKYKKFAEEYPAYVTRYHPELSFNLGELSFREKKYSSSEFYFNDFQRNAPRNHACQVTLLKRIADLSQKTKQSSSVILGKYFTVYERFPKTDLGRFSRIHAYSIEMPFVSDAEATRRVQIIDSELSLIEDRRILRLSQTEKGLSLLKKDIVSALEILNDLKQRDDSLVSKEVSDYVRNSILESVTEARITSKKQKDIDKDELLLTPLEKSYQQWFAGSSSEGTVRSLYESLILNRVDENLQSSKFKRAVGKLERFEESPFLFKSKPSPSFQLKLGSVLSKWWITQAPEERRETAEKFMEKQEVLEKLLKPNAEAIWLEAYLDLEKLTDLGGIAKKYSSARVLTSLLSKDQEKELDPFYLILGKTFRVLKEYEKSQEFLKKIRSKDLLSLRDLEELKVLTDTGKKRQAVDKGLKKVSGKRDQYQYEILDLCRRAVIDGKVWDLSKQVLGAAKAAALTDFQLVPFVLMSGRAFLEQGQYQKSVETYREVLKGSLDSGSKAESHFQMGRSLLNLKDIDGAKKEWNEVISMNDDFWSPLAKNELNLVESK